MREDLKAENNRLRRALLQIAEDAESPQNFYDRNGPQWTTPSGAEYENTSDFLAKCNELASTARAALFSTSTDKLPDVGQWSDDDRARAWRDAFDTMHRRAMKAEAALSEKG